MSPRQNNGGWAAKLHKARQLSASDWVLIFQAAAWFAALEVGLRLLPLRTLVRILRGRRRTAGLPNARVERISRCVDLAARLDPFPATCLKKSLVLYALLRRRGIEVELFIGAAKTNGKLEAHAWLEYQGRAITGGPPTERYAPLWSLVGQPGASRNS
ncbi:MAG TPA: lasso peptide biosynthesis B2 protein [Terriglobia bacterium]|nr:lasso peptide biosynthesis B2 protein [Terriglobia bacterium]